jgi:hypothetical protein
MAIFRFRTALALLLIGFVIGFCMAFLFTGCNKEPALGKSIVTPAKQIVKQVNTMEIKLQEKVTGLEKSNALLKADLQTTKTALVTAKTKKANQEQKINVLTAQKKLLAATIGPVETGVAGGITELSICDSLITEVNLYVKENKEQDSLYERQTLTMDSIAAVKDSVIATHATAYTSLNQLFNQSLIQQDILEKENRWYRKDAKKRKIKNKLVTVGLMIASGFAANYLLHR